MARNYFVKFFMSDKNDMFERLRPKDFADLIKEVMNYTDEGIEVKHIKTDRTNWYEWNDNVPENNDELPIEVWEDRFYQ